MSQIVKHVHGRWVWHRRAGRGMIPSYFEGCESRETMCQTCQRTSCAMPLEAPTPSCYRCSQGMPYPANCMFCNTMLWTKDQCEFGVCDACYAYLKEKGIDLLDPFEKRHDKRIAFSKVPFMVFQDHKPCKCNQCREGQAPLLASLLPDWNVVVAYCQTLGIKVPEKPQPQPQPVPAAIQGQGSVLTSFQVPPAFYYQAQPIAVSADIESDFGG